MARRLVKAGETLFREGDASTYVCRILAGEAEIVKQAGRRGIVLGVARAGEYIGEMGVLEGQPRSATVRARGRLEVEIVGRDAFLARVAEDSVLAFHLLRRLSERLKATGEAFAEAMLSFDDTAAGDNGADEVSEPGVDANVRAILPPLQLFPNSAEIDRLLPSTGIRITRLPYVVGRTLEPGEAAPVSVDLDLPDEPPYRLSPAHFAIGASRGRYVVRDLGSMLGSDVNDNCIGRFFGHDDAALAEGDNIVVAGGLDSPWRFRLRVGQPAQAGRPTPRKR